MSLRNLFASCALAGTLALVVGPCAIGCSSPKYEANLAGAAGEDAVTLVLDPDVRLHTINGKPVSAVPVVGVRDMSRNKGTNKRTILLPPGSHELVAGVGPIFFESGSSRTGYAAPAPMPPGGGTSVSVGIGGGGPSSSASFRYPGSELDRRATLNLQPGKRYTLRIAGDASPESPGWTLEAVDKTGNNAVESVTTAFDSDYDGEPYRRYFPGK